MLSKYNDNHIDMLRLVSQGGVEIYTWDVVNDHTNRENEDVNLKEKSNIDVEDEEDDEEF